MISGVYKILHALHQKEDVILMGMLAQTCLVTIVNFFSFPVHLFSGFRWCCISEAEVSKCLHLANVTSHQIARFARVTCIHGSNVTNCINMVGSGNADFITLGQKNIYQAGRLL